MFKPNLYYLKDNASSAEDRLKNGEETDADSGASDSEEEDDKNRHEKLKMCLISFKFTASF